ncbi:MAG: hypothetical protein JWO57_3691 [Pseudonocardiales bacterium]|nr:hypothetical protein [Pseudonocardiales bacterium]
MIERHVGTELIAARPVLAELAPALRRAASLDPASLARLKIGGDRAAALIRLPFDVLVGRSVAAEPAPGAEAVDVTVRAAELLAWLDGESTDAPPSRDAEWRTGVPPVAGWQRVDTVPDEVVRGLVRTGSRALQEAADRDGVPGARPRAAVADAVLDSVVLTVSAEHGPHAEISLRALSALTRMAFLPRGSHVAVDVAGRWVRVAAEFGSVYVERAGLGLGVVIR